MKTWIDKKRIAPETKKTFKELATQTVMLQRSDFTPYAADDMGIWGALTNDDPLVNSVEIRVVRVEN